MRERIRTVDLTCGRQDESFTLDIDLDYSGTVFCPLESSDTQHVNPFNALVSRLIGRARAKIDIEEFAERNGQVRVHLTCNRCQLRYTYLFEE